MENSRYKSEFGYELETYKWKPIVEPKFVLYLSHGYAGYGGEYSYTRKFIPKMLELGGVVYRKKRESINLNYFGYL